MGIRVSLYSSNDIDWKTVSGGSLDSSGTNLLVDNVIR
jgi:hypothetical protein